MGRTSGRVRNVLATACPAGCCRTGRTGPGYGLCALGGSFYALSCTPPPTTPRGREGSPSANSARRDTWEAVQCVRFSRGTRYRRRRSCAKGFFP